MFQSVESISPVVGRRAARTRGHGAPRGTARLLDLDDELGADLAARQRQAAAAAVIAPVFEFARGRWPLHPGAGHGTLGALLLEGMVAARIETGAQAHLELLGPGDIVSPWTGAGPDLNVPSVLTARVMTTTRVALLDRGFTMRAAPWPEIHAAVVGKATGRARRLALQAAINGLSRIDERLELTLWQLADRFGRVTPGGVLLRLPLSHSQLAEMVAAKRPSVTTAAARLEDKRRLQRLAPHEWLLCGEPPTRRGGRGRRAGLPA